MIIVSISRRKVRRSYFWTSNQKYSIKPLELTETADFRYPNMLWRLFVSFDNVYRNRVTVSNRSCMQNSLGSRFPLYISEKLSKFEKKIQKFLKAWKNYLCFGVNFLNPIHYSYNFLHVRFQPIWYLVLVVRHFEYYFVVLF